MGGAAEVAVPLLRMEPKSQIQVAAFMQTSIPARRNSPNRGTTLQSALAADSITATSCISEYAIQSAVTASAAMRNWRWRSSMKRFCISIAVRACLTSRGSRSSTYGWREFLPPCGRTSRGNRLRRAALQRGRRTPAKSSSPHPRPLHGLPLATVVPPASEERSFVPSPRVNQPEPEVYLAASGWSAPAPAWTVDASLMPDAGKNHR